MSGILHTPSPSDASTSPYPASSTTTITTNTTAVVATTTSATAKDNASRLRENQRRSRARKKEYLNSLEARVQACQRTGIEANVEIQNAAKRVVRENLLLREMLRRRGVGDEEIDRALRDGGEEGGDGESAVEGVVKMLGRRPCGGADTVPVGVMGQERFIDRRNSTGMLAARDVCDRPRRGGVGIGGGETSCSPPSTGASTKCSSQQIPLSPPSPVLPLHRAPPPAPPPQPPPQPFSPQHYPSPSGTPTSASIPAFTTPAPPAQLAPSPYYTFSSPPSHFSPTTTTCPATSTTSAGTYSQYYPSTTSPPPSSCCYSPHQPHQQQQYPTSTTPCHLAQTFIQQLRPQNGSQLVNEICPGDLGGGQCHVDSSVLFGLLDKI